MIILNLNKYSHFLIIFKGLLLIKCINSYTIYEDYLGAYHRIIGGENVEIQEIDMDFEHFKKEIEYDTNSSPKCGQDFDLEKIQKIEIKSPNFGWTLYPQWECSWNFMGSYECKPGIVCDTLDLKIGHNCDEEYLEFSDGFDETQRLCEKFTGKFISSSKSKDLYITSKLIGGKEPRLGFNCTITCEQITSVSTMTLPTARVPMGRGIKDAVDKLKKVKINDNCVCGIPNQDRDRIVGGENAERNEFPWIVAIVKKGTRKPVCSGSIINDRYILTAAHCFKTEGSEMSKNEVDVLVNAHILDMTGSGSGSIKYPGWDSENLTDEEDGSTRFNVEKLIAHSLFSLPNYDWDVALLQLDKKIDLSSSKAKAVPICLTPENIHFDDYAGQSSLVSGWGMGDEKAGESTRILQKLSNVKIYRELDCFRFSPYTITHRQMCAGYVEGGKDACQGDSGGPLIMEISRQWTQVGIVSFGEGCARKDSLGFYSRISELTSWIKNYAKSGVYCKLQP